MNTTQEATTTPVITRTMRHLLGASLLFDSDSASMYSYVSSLTNIELQLLYSLCMDKFSVALWEALINEMINNREAIKRFTTATEQVIFNVMQDRMSANDR